MLRQDSLFLLFCPHACLTDHSTHRSMEEPTADECYIHVRRGGKRLTTGVTEQKTKLS